MTTSERRKKSKREWKDKNKRKVKRYNRDYYLRHKDEIKNQQAGYRMENPEKIKEMNRKSYLNWKIRKAKTMIYNIRYNRRRAPKKSGKIPVIPTNE